MGLPNPFATKKDLSQLQQEDEELEVELNIEKKRALIKQLKEKNVSLNNFGGSIKAAINWLKTH